MKLVRVKLSHMTVNDLMIRIIFGKVDYPWGFKYTVYWYHRELNMKLCGKSAALCIFSFCSVQLIDATFIARIFLLWVTSSVGNYCGFLKVVLFVVINLLACIVNLITEIRVIEKSGTWASAVSHVSISFKALWRLLKDRFSTDSAW